MSHDVRLESDPPAPLSVLADGLEWAWRLRWSLFAVTAVALVPAFLLGTAVDLVAVRSSASIVNGELLIFARNDFLGGGGRLFDAYAALSFGAVAAVGVAWVLALAAAMLLTAGVMRGVHTGRRAALRAAVRRMPTMILAVVGLGIVAVVAVWVALGLMAIVGVTSAFVVWAGLFGVGLLVARLGIGLPALALTKPGSGGPTLSEVWQATRGRTIEVLVPVMLGAAVLPLLLVWAVDGIGRALIDGASLTGVPGIALVTIASIASDLALVAVVVLQATVLAAAFAKCWPVDGASGGTEVPSSRTASWRARAAAALLAVPALVVAAVTVANPYGAPEVHRTGDDSFPGKPGSASEIHPLWAECSPDDCRRSVNTATHWALPYDSSTVLTDGTWVSVMQRDTDRIYVQRCRHGDSVCGSSGDSVVITWPSIQPGSPKTYGVTAADDGRVWIAAAEDVAVDDPHPDVSTMLELSILACDDWTCQSSTHTTLGRSHSSLDGPGDPFSMSIGYNNGEANEDPFVAHAFGKTSPGHQLELSLDADGVPFVVHSGWATETLATCGNSECSTPLVVEESGGVGTVPIGGVSDGVVGIASNMLTYCPNLDCEQRTVDGAGTLMVVSESGVIAGEFGLVAVMSEPVSRERDGVYVSINVGSANPGRDASWRTVLLHCDDYLCSDPTLIPIGLSDDPPSEPALMIEDGTHVRLWYTTGQDEHEVELTLD